MPSRSRRRMRAWNPYCRRRRRSRGDQLYLSRQLRSRIHPRSRFRRPRCQPQHPRRRRQPRHQLRDLRSRRQDRARNRSGRLALHPVAPSTIPPRRQRPLWPRRPAIPSRWRHRVGASIPCCRCTMGRRPNSPSRRAPPRIHPLHMRPARLRATRSRPLMQARRAEVPGSSARRARVRPRAWSRGSNRTRRRNSLRWRIVRASKAPWPTRPLQSRPRITRRP